MLRLRFELLPGLLALIEWGRLENRFNYNGYRCNLRIRFVRLLNPL